MILARRRRRSVLGCEERGGGRRKERKRNNKKLFLSPPPTTAKCRNRTWPYVTHHPQNLAKPNRRGHRCVHRVVTPSPAHKNDYFFFWTIAGSQWRQAQILSRWLVGANGHSDLLREPLRPPYRRHFRSSVDLAAHRSRAPHLNRCIVKGWTLDLIGTGY